MKFKLFDRFIYALILLVVAALAVGLFLVALHIIPFEAASGMVAALYGYTINSALLIVAGIILLTFVFKLLFANTRSSAPATTHSALVKAGEFGNVVMSLEALNAMVQKHCRANSKIRECDSTVAAVEGGVTIRLKLSLMPDCHIPEVTQELQESLKQYIEELTGIHVAEISILIVPPANQMKSQRVE